MEYSCRWSDRFLNFPCYAIFGLVLLGVAIPVRTASGQATLSVPDRITLSPASASPISVADLVGYTRIGSRPLNARRQNSYSPQPLQKLDEIIWSPDNDRVAVLLHRGNLKRNVREYELLVFRATELLDGPEGAKVVAMSSSSNRPAIRNVRWINRNTLAFLGENPGELPQVHVVDVDSGVVEKKTESPTRVFSFDVSADAEVVVYEAERARDASVKAKRMAHGFVLDQNASLATLMAREYDLLEIPSGRAHWELSYDLWIIRGKAQPSKLQIKGDVFERMNGHRFYVSPGADWLLVRCSVDRPPERWGAYRLGGENFNYKSAEQWVAVQLEAGHVTPLIDAPIPPVEANRQNQAGGGYDGTLLWSPDGASVVLSNAWMPRGAHTSPSASSAKGERHDSNLYSLEVDLATGDISVLEEFDSNTGMLADYWEPDGTVRLERWNKGTTGKWLTPTYQDIRWIRDDASSYRYLKNSDGNWVRHGTEDTRPVLDIEQGANTSPRVVAIVPGLKEKRTVVDPNPGFWSKHRLAVTTSVAWRYGDGVEGEAKLYWPADYEEGQRYPLVVQGHGYMPENFEPWGSIQYRVQGAQVLANAGFFVVQYFEGGPKWHSNDFTTYDTSAFAKLEGLIDTLDVHGLIDRSRVGLSGLSTDYGFFMSFMVHSEYPIAAAVLGEGVDRSYLQYLKLASIIPAWARDWERFNGGHSPWGEGASTWFARATGFNLHKIDTPIRFDVGMSDDHLAGAKPGNGLNAVLSTWENYQGMSILGKPVEMVVLPEANHEGYKPWSTYTSQQGAVDWFRFWLQGYERTEPCVDVGETADQLTEQYSRWRAMRENAGVEVALN